MAERFGARMGRDILFGSQNYARDAFDPSEARDPGGKWTGGGGGGGGGSGGGGSEAPKAGASGGASSGSRRVPGVRASGPDDAAKWRDEITATSDLDSIDKLMAASEINQPDLAKTAEAIAKDIGADLKNPGMKKRERLAEKLARPGKKPQRITDAVRLGFDVKAPEHADEVIKKLAEKYPIADEGWVKTPAGYFDRKAMVTFPNGQMGEVQMWPPGMLEAKEVKGGHTLYEESQKLPKDSPKFREITQKMVDLYSPVLAALPPSWNALVGKAGS